MRRVAKLALGALMLAGTAVGVATPASAGVSIGIGFGPGYWGPGYWGPAPYAYCNPYSRYYDPYYCDDYDYYYGSPIFYDGYWFSGPLRTRWYDGRREFWIRDGWRYSDRYRGGGHFYHGGGRYTGGHYGGGHYGGGYYGGGHYGGGHYGGGYRSGGGGGFHGGGYGGGHGGGHGGRGGRH